MAAEGIVLPEFQAKPELFCGNIEAWDAFWRLNTSRAIGFGGLGYIPLSEILAYFRWQGINNPSRQELLFHLIRVMDNEYLRIVNEDKEKPQAGGDE